MRGGKLSQATYDRVMELLASDTPRRAIARRLHISRATIDNIASGKYEGRLKQAHNIQTYKNMLPKYQHTGTRAAPIVTSVTGVISERCPKCGRKVQMPCFACAVENGEVTKVC